MSLHIHDNCLPLEYATLLKKDLNIPAAITIFEQQTTNLKTKDMDIRRTLTALALLLPLSAMAVPTDDDRTGTMTNEPSQDVTTVSFTIDTSALARIFMDPPKEARPQVWWHWMDGNVSKEGIRKDIEWMKRSGIGGFHQFDAGGINMPRAAKVKLPYLSDGWKEAFRFALYMADSLDMDVTIASAPGWSSTGGKWVKPEDAIKKLEWRHVDVRGGKVSTKLPDLYNVVGPYQDYHVGNDRIEVKPYGKDLYVIAVRLPASDKAMRALTERVEESDSCITVEFRQPQTIKALTLQSMAMGARPKIGDPAPGSVLESSDDGRQWRKVCDIEPSVLPYMTKNIPQTCARFFRVTGRQLVSLDLFTVSKINHSQEVGGFGIVHDFWKYGTAYSSDAIRTSDVVNLTGKMTPDGRLECTLPAGRWRIYRFGWSITGKINHPASPEATGLEVDKLDPDAWMRYFHTYVDLYKNAADGMLGKKGIRYLLVDSYEAGSFTWTPRLAEEFKKRRGYNLVPWLPVLTGEIIGSSQMSERFLWDWRKTLGELFCENYDRINDIVKEYELDGRYTETHEGSRAYTGDGMDPKIKATIPMAAFWMENTPNGSAAPAAVCDIRESASVSHIYGQPIVAAESFSVDGDHGRAYTYCPENMKYIADVGLSAGVNRFVVHESASQPNDKYLPGMQLFRYGQWLHRNETWGEYAWTLTNYLARSSAMLQQGHSVADILLYYGEDINVTAIYGGDTFSTLPDVPDGFNYDFANPTVIKSGVHAKDGRLVAPSGASYKVLWIGRDQDFMSLEILKRIKAFADAGVIICGKEPKRCAGMKADDRSFASLVDNVWHSRRKNVFTCSLEECLSRSGMRPDFIATATTAQKSLPQIVPAAFEQVEAPANAKDSYGDFKYVHRNLPGNTQVYWVRNFSGEDKDVDLSFKDGGRYAALLNPENGEVADIPVTQKDGRFIVSTPMLSTDARFIVFTDTPMVSVREIIIKTQSSAFNLADTIRIDCLPFAKTAVQKSSEQQLSVLQTVGSSWNVHFEQKNGGTADKVFSELRSWTEEENPVVKYFSGTAVYSTTLELDSKALASDGRIFMDLGTVKNIAEVTVNGSEAGVLWKAPFRTGDIRHLLKEGENHLEIKVTNLWRNRMIGDVQSDEKHPVTAIRRFYKAGDKLLPSGLLGPVVIVEED